MIKITIEVMASDFKTADKILKKTLEQGVDSVSDIDGASYIEVWECDKRGIKVELLNYSQELKKGGVE